MMNLLSKQDYANIHGFIKCPEIQLTVVHVRAGKIALFYLVFYCVVGGFFAIHLLLFTCHAPEPGPGVRPRNFGRFAYPNYPNSPLSRLKN